MYIDYFIVTTQLFDRLKNGREVLSLGTTLRHAKCTLQVIQIANRPVWPDLETRSVSHFS